MAKAFIIQHILEFIIFHADYEMDPIRRPIRTNPRVHHHPTTHMNVPLIVPAKDLRFFVRSSSQQIGNFNWNPIRKNEQPTAGSSTTIPSSYRRDERNGGTSHATSAIPNDGRFGIIIVYKPTSSAAAADDEGSSAVIIFKPVINTLRCNHSSTCTPSSSTCNTIIILSWRRTIKEEKIRTPRGFSPRSFKKAETNNVRPEEEEQQWVVSRYTTSPSTLRDHDVPVQDWIIVVYW